MEFGRRKPSGVHNREVAAEGSGNNPREEAEVTTTAATVAGTNSMAINVIVTNDHPTITTATVNIFPWNNDRTPFRSQSLHIPKLGQGWLSSTIVTTTTTATKVTTAP